MPHSEPNSLPDVFSDWQEWRSRYEEIVSDYNTKRIDRIRLRALLTMMGYRGRDLEAELEFCLANRPK